VEEEQLRLPLRPRQSLRRWRKVKEPTKVAEKKNRRKSEVEFSYNPVRKTRSFKPFI
jgi:hypothetical protein